MNKKPLSAGIKLPAKSKKAVDQKVPAVQSHRDPSEVAAATATYPKALSRRTAGHALAEPAVGIRERATRVIDLAERTSIANEIQHGTCKDGKKSLRITFPRAGQSDQIIDVSSLTDLPNLVDGFAEGLRHHLSPMATSSRVAFTQAIRTGLISYLRSAFPLAHLNELTLEVFTAYVRWQDSPAASVDGKRALSVATCLGRITAARGLLESLRRLPRWGSVAAKALGDYPRNTHKKSQAFCKPRKILSFDVLKAIQGAALDEIEQINIRVQEGVRFLSEGRKALAAGDNDYSKAPIALAALVARYPGIFPPGEQILQDDFRLGQAVYQPPGGSKSHGLNSLARYRYASSRDLLPFVLLLTIEGGFNPETVLGMTRAGIQPRTLMGVSVTSVEGPKGRAKGGTYAKDLDTAIVGPWFALLEQLTEPLRDVLPTHQKDYVFAFSPIHSSSASVKVLGNRRENSSNCMALKSTLEAFCCRHGLAYFNLAQLRPTLLDLVGQNHGSIAASRAGRHVQFRTTEGHYLGAGTRDREREKLANTVRHMERWIASDGRIDVRKAARPMLWGHGSSTPRFECADPYDSPISGQRKKRLCRAFGACPTCALCGADFSDSLAVAYWLALEAAIYAAREFLDPPHWLSTWAPIASELQSMIKQVSDTVRTEALSFSVYLPPVG